MINATPQRPRRIDNWRGYSPTLVALPLPFLAALGYSGGWPWDPTPVDFDVYRRTAQELVTGQPLYDANSGQLPMTYPPFAAVAALPLLLVSSATGHVAWPLLNALLATLVLVRVGLSSWRAPLAAAAAIALGGPYDQVVFLGQIGIVLMAICVLDLAPGRTLINRIWPARERLFPRGSLTGIAVAIKLTPALFIVGVFFLGWRRTAVVATISALAATGIAALLRPSDSLRYWGNLAAGQLPQEPDSMYRTTNQSVGAIVIRFGGDPDTWQLAALVACALAGIAAVISAAMIARAGQIGYALLLLGLGTSLASPVAWTHTFTWLLPIAVIVMVRPAPTRVRVLAVSYLGWAIVEPFKAIRAPGTEPLSMSGVAQFVDAVGPLLGMALFGVTIAWALSVRSRPTTALEPVGR